MYKMLKRYGIKPWEIEPDNTVYYEDVSAIRHFLKFEDVLAERKRNEGEREQRLANLRKRAGF
jgi:hypothetical protein